MRTAMVRGRQCSLGEAEWLEGVLARTQLDTATSSEHQALAMAT
jgi:hypothetical protein